MRCGHADGDLGEYVRAGHRKGLPVDRHLRPSAQLSDADPELSMAPEELGAYVDEVHGAEARAIPASCCSASRPTTGRTPSTPWRAAGRAIPFDYVIGSVHHIDGWGFDDPRPVDEWDRRDVDEVYRRYFELVGDSAETGLVHHPGAPGSGEEVRPPARTDPARRCGGGDGGPDRARGDARRDQHGRSAPAGRRDLSRTWPSCAASAVPRGGITFGSDAHTPAEVGSDFDRAAALALAAGYVEYAALVPDEPRAAARARIRMRSIPQALGPAGSKTHGDGVVG